MDTQFKVLPFKVHKEGKIYRTARRFSTSEAVSFLARKIKALPANQYGVAVAAVGGPSGVGKSHLSVALARVLGNTRIIEMDNWCGPLGKRDLTPEEVLEVLGLEQFRKDLITLMENGSLEHPPKYVFYRTLDQPREYEETPLVLGGKNILIINGAIVLHDRLKEIAQLRIGLNSVPDIRRMHLAKRGPYDRPEIPKYGFSVEAVKNAHLLVDLKYQDGRYSYEIFE